LSVQDSSRSALDLVHSLLSLPATEQPGLDGLLTQLIEAFAATAAGLAALPDSAPILRAGSTEAIAAPLPWENDAALLARLVESSDVVVLPRSAHGSLVVQASRRREPGLLVWLEDEKRSDWTRAETAAFALFADALARNNAPPPETAPRWLEQRDRRLRQQRLEQTVPVVRRLAHDFGNALTGVLGFAELCLGQQVEPGSTLHDFLSELQRGAKHAARWTQLLQLFSLRQARGPFACSLPEALRAEESRQRKVWKPTAELVLDVPATLPAPIVCDEHLRQVVGILLENSYEALPDNVGVVTLSARRIDLTGPDCLEYYGRPQPGPHVEVRVSDTGAGLTPEVQSRLFAELFFTTKMRHRGLGLAVAYGLATANRGGIRLVNAPGQGVIAEVVFPALVIAAAPLKGAPEKQTVPRGEKILVVDDDPLVLRFVTKTLERAGYRVHAVTTAAEALASYDAQQVEPIRLVVSDLMMPQIGGLDLAQRLLQRDSNVRLLFMSGHAVAEAEARSATSLAFATIQKPFPSERLLSAVRSAIDRGEPVRSTA